MPGSPSRTLPRASTRASSRSRSGSSCRSRSAPRRPTRSWREELGRPPDLVRRLSGELGFPPPEDDGVRAEDAEILRLLFTRLDLADDEELSRFARLYGGTIQRLVGSGLQFFDLGVRQRVAALEGLSNEEKDALVYQKAAGYTELVASIVPWLQGRHRERSVLEYLVGVTEGFMEERGITPRSRSSRPPSPSST